MSPCDPTQLQRVNARYVAAGIPWTLAEPGPTLIEVLPLKLLAAPDPTYLRLDVGARMQHLLRALRIPCDRVKPKHVSWAASLPVPADQTRVNLVERALSSDFDDMCGVAVAMEDPALRPCFVRMILSALEGWEPESRLRAALVGLTPIVTPDDEDLLLTCCAHASASVLLATLRALARLGTLQTLAMQGISCHPDHEETLACALDVALSLKADALDHLLRSDDDSARHETLRLTLDALQRAHAAPSPSTHEDVRAVAACLLDHYAQLGADTLSLTASWCLGLCVKRLGDEVAEPLLAAVKRAHPMETSTRTLLNALTRYQGPHAATAALAAEVYQLPTLDDDAMILAKARVYATLRGAPGSAPVEAWLSARADCLFDLYDPTHAPPPEVAMILNPGTDPVAARACLRAATMGSKRWHSDSVNGLGVASAFALNPNIAHAAALLVRSASGEAHLRAALAGALLNSPLPLHIEPVVLRAAAGVSLGGQLPRDARTLGLLLGLCTHSAWDRAAARLLKGAIPHDHVELTAAFFEGRHYDARQGEAARALRVFGLRAPAPPPAVSERAIDLLLLRKQKLSASLREDLMATAGSERAHTCAMLWAHLIHSFSQGKVGAVSVKVALRAADVWLLAPAGDLLNAWAVAAMDTQSPEVIQTLCGLLTFAWPRLREVSDAPAVVQAGLARMQGYAGQHADKVSAAALSCGVSLASPDT